MTTAKHNKFVQALIDIEEVLKPVEVASLSTVEQGALLALKTMLDSLITKIPTP